MEKFAFFSFIYSSSSSVTVLALRTTLFFPERFKISSDVSIKKGDILISNSKYLRYEGELEIALKNLGIDEKRCIVSKIIEEDMELIDYINIVKKFEFIHNDNSN